MKISALAELKKELNYLNEKELVSLLIDLSKFSRDNKAFLHFKLHERDQPALFVDTVKENLEELFQTANTKTYFFAKKSAQSIRRKLNKSLKLSKKKEDQVELLLCFCEQLQRYGYLKFQHPIIKHLFDMQVKKIQQGIGLLHDDLQYDYKNRLDDILDERS